MVGHTADETVFTHAMADRTLFVLTEEALRTRLAVSLGARSDEAIDLYRGLNPDMTPSDLFFRITTDQSMGMGSVKLAERQQAQGQAPVYFYKFTWTCPTDDGAYRSAHNFEMPFVFENLGYTPMVSPVTPETSLLADQMCDAWVAFARSGDPNHPGLPAWPAFEPQARPTMNFNLQSKLENDPDKTTRLWWEASGLARGLGD